MEASLQEARLLLQEALDFAPKCHRCPDAAVYWSPTAVIGDYLLTCEEHRGPEENEFGNKRHRLRQYDLNQRIKKFLDETAGES